MATKQQQGHDIVTVTFVSLLGVGLFAVLAGMSDNMGKLMLIFMWGLVIGWALLHTQQLGTMVKSL